MAPGIVTDISDADTDIPGFAQEMQKPQQYLGSTRNYWADETRRGISERPAILSSGGQQT